MKAKKKQENEWEETDQPAQKKTKFKLEGKDVEDMTQETKADKEDVAKWDETDPELFKSEQTTLAPVAQTKQEEAKDSKSASDIQFGGAMPKFGGGPPKFSKSKNEKIVNEEEFPEIGGDLAAKKSGAKAGDDKQATGSKSSGAPKFSGGANRFEGLKDVAAAAPATQTEDDKAAGRHDRKHQPRKPKDEFFGNFRSANKDIKTKEPESKPEPTEKKEEASSGGPPKFHFTNTKKDAMTMAKAQEIALKEKEVQDKLREEEEKNKKHSDKKYGDKKFGDKKFGDKKFGDKKDFKPRDKTDKFERPSDKKTDEKKPVEKKTKPVKPKVAGEKADMGENDWGTGSLEDMLK
jgi:hypothetical protein